MRKGSLLKLLSFSVLLSIAGCGVSEKSLQNGQKRIDALKEKGMPDTLLSKAKMYLVQARDEQKRNNLSVAAKAADSLNITLKTLEKSYAQDLGKLIPEVQALLAEVNQAKSTVTGMQLGKLDSLTQITDSLITIKYYPDAAAKLKQIITLLPQLQTDEKNANELRPKVIGTWTCTNVTKSNEDKNVNAVEKKIFILGADGKCRFIENKKGQSSITMKEDYEYVSYGTYDMKGDTVYCSINRFAAVRQNFSKLSVDMAKKTKKWIPEKHPTYDTLITDKSQDRYVTYPDLVKDFVQTR
jgi:hypothetical protein